MTETDLTLMLGGRSRDELRSMLAAQGVKPNGYAEELLTQSSVDAHAPQAVVLTQRTVAELGLPRGGTLPQIFTAGEERGLLPCPLETGPYLRLALSDQEQAPDSVLSAGTGPDRIAPRPLGTAQRGPRGAQGLLSPGRRRGQVAAGVSLRRRVRAAARERTGASSADDGGAVSGGRPARIRARAVVVDLDDTLFDHRESARRGLARLIHSSEGRPRRRSSIPQR